jgi:hypothetical protein
MRMTDLPCHFNACRVTTGALRECRLGRAVDIASFNGLIG